MGPSARIAALTAPLRAFAVRFHRRTADMSRLPFAIALAASVTLLLAAVEFTPDHDSRVGGPTDPLEERFEEDHIWEVEEREVAVSVLESGFGAVVDHRGVERLSMGAVLFNPNRCDAQLVTVEVTALDSDGERHSVEQVYLDYIPPESRVLLGHVLLERGVGVADEPKVSVSEASCWFPEGDPSEAELREMGWLFDRPQPEIRIVGIEPLVGPPGQRVVFEIDTSGAEDYTTQTRIDVVFRDADGEIVGGMPGWGDPFNQTVTAAEYRAIPPGVSIQHLDLPQGRIPEGADLERTEIGPVA